MTPGFSFIADKYFGVADILGAFVAGIILSSLDDSKYIDRKMDVNSYMIFGPIFFVSIGLQTDLKSLDMTILDHDLATCWWDFCPRSSAAVWSLACVALRGQML